MASAKRSSGGVCTCVRAVVSGFASAAHRRSARAETTKPAAKRKLLLPLLLSSPWLRLNLNVVILRRTRVSAPAPEAAAGFAAPQDGVGSSTGPATRPHVHRAGSGVPI